MGSIQRFGDMAGVAALLNNYILSIDTQQSQQFADNFTSDGFYNSP